MEEQNEIEWLKAMIAEDEASGVQDAEPEDILAEIMAKLPASDCP